MSIRVSTLVWMMSLALATGCPGGDGDGESEGNAGAAGTGAGAGAGASGTQAGTGGGASGEGGGSSVTPEQAMAGLCDSEMGGGMGSCMEVGGLDEYMACAESTCMIGACSEGPCADTYACYQTADDPCTCEQSSACQQCYVDKGLCLFDCVELITCDGEPILGGGDTMEGGACDQLDACCEGLGADTMQACTLAAAGARTVGDSACEGVLASLCPTR